MSEMRKNPDEVYLEDFLRRGGRKINGKNRSQISQSTMDIKNSDSINDQLFQKIMSGVALGVFATVMGMSLFEVQKAIDQAKIDKAKSEMRDAIIECLAPYGGPILCAEKLLDHEIYSARNCVARKIKIDMESLDQGEIEDLTGAIDVVFLENCAK